MSETIDRARTLDDVTMDVEELCQVLRLKKRTAYQYLADGLIPSIRIGKQIRVRRDTVEQILEHGVYKRVV
jgi:excisionase family DNA binding protein